MNSWQFVGRKWKELFKRTFQKFKRDDMSGEAAKLAFYMMLAIFPFLLSLAALLGLALEGNSLLKHALDDYFTRVAPSSVTNLISKTLTEVTSGSKGQKLSLGLVVSVWAASRGMLGLMRALNIAYEVGEGRTWWKARLVALALTLTSVVFLAIALFLLIIGGPFAVEMAGKLGIGNAAASLWNIFRWPAVLIFILFAFNALYRYAPNLQRRTWQNLMPGTVLAVALWIAASFGFKLYVSHFNNYSVTYGSIGAVITLLMWLYVSAAAILVGAEMNSELESEANNIEPKVSPA